MKIWASGWRWRAKKVLLVDADPQGSLTISMGWQLPDELPTTLSTLMAKAMNDQPILPGEGILHHAEGVDLIPANIELAGLEVALVNSMNREKMLKQVLEGAKHDYDLIVWNNTLVDGHNRYAILQKHPEICFSTMPLPFKSREEVLAWICKNQFPPPTSSGIVQFWCSISTGLHSSCLARQSRRMPRYSVFSAAVNC